VVIDDHDAYGGHLRRTTLKVIVVNPNSTSGALGEYAVIMHGRNQIVERLRTVYFAANNERQAPYLAAFLPLKGESLLTQSCGSPCLS